MSKWKVRFNIGFKIFDDQHKALFDLISKLLDTGLFSDNVGDILDEIIEYSTFHFSKEEEYMEKYKHPHYRNHLVAHLNLLQELNTITKYFKKHGRYKKDPNYLIFKWLNHIQYEDVLYVNQFRNVIDRGQSIGNKSLNDMETGSTPISYIFDPEHGT
jgi:hemerythrin